MNCNNNGMLKCLAAIIIFASCNAVKPSKPADKMPGINTADSFFIESLLLKYPQYFGEILKNKEALNVQIIYTQINRQANGTPQLSNHYFNVNPGKYFYPASTVKLPVALLALQKLSELKDKGIDRNTTMLTETSFSGQTAVFNDPASTDGRPTIANYIKKILLVSDNDAYNRLYEFLGQEYINTEMKRRGYDDVQIIHRLNIFLTEAENRTTNPVKFYNSTGSLIYEQPAQTSAFQYAARKDSLGIGYYSGGKLRNGPMDFSKKNRLGLQALHKIVISTIFPESVKTSERFNISEDDRQFVLRYMSMYPTESQYPPYSADTAAYWPTYCKFLFYGGERTKPEDNIRIFNKPGDAYGHMIDAAYIADYKNKIEFFVSAVIYCNGDGILNDDQYDYKTVGEPFMKNLGRVIYNYELGRETKTKPDLSSLLFSYDK